MYKLILKRLFAKGLKEGKYTLTRMGKIITVNGEPSDNSQLAQLFDHFKSNHLDILIYKNGSLKINDHTNQKTYEI